MTSARKKTTLSNRLALSTAITAALLSGYGSRQAFAGSCPPANPVDGTYSCSGGADAINDIAQVINESSSVTVTTTEGFGIDTSRVRYSLALILTTTGNGLTFTDNNMANITGDVGGISAFNNGTGALSITSNGTVSSTATSISNALSTGISAVNTKMATDITIDVVDVIGGKDGIRALNFGEEGQTTRITSTGTVAGTTGDGIFAENHYTGIADLIINAVNVTGYSAGINAENSGKGGISITSTGMATGINNEGLYAILFQSNANLTINAVDVTGGTDGIYAKNYGKGATIITVNGAITGGTGAGISTDNATGVNDSTFAPITITLNDGASVSASSGTAITNDQSNSTVTVNSGASVTGSIDLGTGNDLVMLNGRLNIADGLAALAVIGNLNSSGGGIINAQNNSAGDAVSVNGDFAGGGQLLIDADFATNTADTFTISGNVLAGGTQISINDVSSGAATGADITLVSIGGTTADDDFVLAAPVANGAFNYNTLTLVGSDFILQSVAVGGGPVFTPAAASFESVGASLLALQSQGLSSLAGRTNNRISGANSGDAFASDIPIWLRIVGGEQDIDSNSSTTSSNLESTYWRAQLGADFTVTDDADGQFIAGINISYGQSDTDISSAAGNSGIDTDSYSVGLSGTWYKNNGVYVDLQAQRSWYESDFSASGAGGGNINGIDGDGVAASIEVGRTLALSNNFTLTPQLQLSYADTDLDDFTGSSGERVELIEGKSIKARLGANLAKQFRQDGATRGFISINIIHEFEDETETEVDGFSLINSVDQWSGEIGAGLTHAWGSGTTQYEFSATVTAGTSLEHFGDSNSLQGELGFKAKF